MEANLSLDMAESGLLELLAKLYCFRTVCIGHGDLPRVVKASHFLVNLDQPRRKVLIRIHAVDGTKMETK